MNVFVAGNGLPERWQGRERFVVLETGFGLGHNFLATWQAWRDDPQRCARLVFISIEAHAPTADALRQAHGPSALPDLAEQLLTAWPPLTPNLHALDFENGRVQLQLALGEVPAWLPELRAEVDAFYLGGFASAHDPRSWDARVCKGLSRLAAPQATLAAASDEPDLRRHLTSAGFELCVAPETDNPRDITLGRYAPSFTPRRATVSAVARTDVEPHALIVGAGLAGCSAAWALSEQGWRSTLFERRPRIASEASGNPAGLFHGIVNAQDGVHARFNRAAALLAQRAVQIAVAEHGVSGAVRGLLRLENTATVDQMQAVLQALHLPRDYVEALNADQASATSGLPLSQPAWFYPSGGWVHPAGLARSWLERASAQATLRTDSDVQALRRTTNGWCLLDADGATLAEAATVVLANADAALRLLGNPDWPIEQVRGQISLLPASALTLPHVPVAGAGYLLPEVDGRAVFGATSQRGDTDGAVRTIDHAANLAQLARLTGIALDVDPAAMQGRTAWRLSAMDRLPVIGAVPDPSATALRLDQPRFVPRLPGLFVFTALGSRGITWSALGARVLAASLTGAPAPMEASLLDAVDPARFVSRAARRRPRG